MAFAIILQDVSRNGEALSEDVLAHSIFGADETYELTKRLATSFPEHGYDGRTGSWWFRARDGATRRLKVASHSEIADDLH